MRRYIENIIGFVLVGISMLVQMRYIQKTQYSILNICVLHIFRCRYDFSYNKSSGNKKI